MYSSIAAAARLPAPMARITVAAPVTASPPANTPSLEVMPSLVVSHDAALAVGLQARGGVADQRVRAGADRRDNAVQIEHKLAALDRDRTAAAGGVRLAQLHLLRT